MFSVHFAQYTNPDVHVPFSTVVTAFPVKDSFAYQPPNVYPARVTSDGKLNVAVSTLHAVVWLPFIVPPFLLYVIVVAPLGFHVAVNVLSDVYSHLNAVPAVRIVVPSYQPPKSNPAFVHVFVAGVKLLLYVAVPFDGALPAPSPHEYVTVYLFAIQLGLYLPSLLIVLYPGLQLVAYVHTPNGALNVQFAPVPAAHAVHAVHWAYIVTDPSLSAVRFFTVTPSAYAVPEPSALVFHPLNLFVPFVNAFALSFLSSLYV